MGKPLDQMVFQLNSIENFVQFLDSEASAVGSQCHWCLVSTFLNGGLLLRSWWVFNWLKHCVRPDRCWVCRLLQACLWSVGWGRQGLFFSSMGLVCTAVVVLW